MKTLAWLSLLWLLGCAGAPHPATPAPAPVPTCTGHQLEIEHEADRLAAPWTTAQHLQLNFTDGRVAWLMKDTSYQNYVVKPGATRWGRCDDTGCYAFAAPASVIHTAVEQSMIEGHHDAAVLGKALGLPAANFEGPLRMMTMDLDDTAACARLPVDSDPGVWKCKSADDTDCFKFGGYTSGGVPELMVIDAPVGQTTIEEVP